MTVIGRNTLNQTELLEVDLDPSINSTNAKLGSLSGYTTDKTWFSKYGSGGTDWVMAVPKVSTVNTTDAAVVQIDLISIPTNTVAFLDIVIIGKRTSGSPFNTAAYRIFVRYENNAGTVAKFNETAIYTSEDDATWDTNTAVSTTNAQIRVKGAANTNISWKSITYMRFV